MELSNHMPPNIVISHERLSGWAGILFSMQFVGVILAVDCFRLLGFEWSDVITGIIIYVPMVIALGLLIPSFIHMKHGYGFYLFLWLILSLTIIWFAVDSFGSYDVLNQSAFDMKRPYFFVQGVTLAGLVGLVVVTNWRSFALSFMKLTLGASILACGLFLSTYHLNFIAGRLGGATALQHAIVFTCGVSCAFAFLFLMAKGLFHSRVFTAPVLWVVIVFLIMGILASGTRAALFGAIFSAMIYVILLSSRKRLRNFFILIMTLSIVCSIAIQWVPPAAIERVTHIEVGGLNRRTQLTGLAFVSFEHHLFGKTRGYMQALDGVDYAHDTLLQMLLETGIIGAPILLILLVSAVRGALKYFRSDPLLSGFLIVLFNFILQSFSSGTGYDAQFWFSVLFLAALTKRNVIENHQPALAIMREPSSA